MLSEREYRIKCINNNFSKMQCRNIVVYGTGINARLIIDYLGKTLNIIGLMDKGRTGEVLYGYKILSEDEVVALTTDTIIIAAQIDSAIEIYKRIQILCKKYNIDVYDLYGNNVRNLLNTIVEIKADSIGLPNSVILAEEKIKEAIDSVDVISIDLKALFSDSFSEEDLLHQVWESHFHYGTKSFTELRRRIVKRYGKSCDKIDSVYSLLKTYLCLSEEDKKRLLETELELRNQHIRINSFLGRLVAYIRKEKKKLILINDTLFPDEFWSSCSDSMHIGLILNCSKSGYNKYNGMYREIIDCEPEKKYLHIGTDYCEDGIAAAVYGFRSIVIRKESEILSADNDLSQDIFLFEDQCHEYCTDNIQYTIMDCPYHGYQKLLVNGNYYVIVNRAAVIRPGWLEQLIYTADNQKDASVICSKVCSKNGAILYAGEIVHEDSIVQKSQMVSGFLPLYDYVHCAKQISLVSFLVWKTEWDEIEKATSELRETVEVYANSIKLNQVIYQPLSEVIYVQSDLELASLFTDITIISQPKVLITDNLLTQFDHDAGSRTAWLYMLLFHKLGFDVTLMAQNFNEIQPYVMLLQQAGIRVIYGDYYRSNWKKWLKEEKDSFTYIYMQRPQSTAFFLEMIRKHCKNAKFFYYACDLQFLRLYRGYMINGNPDDLKESENSKIQECALIETMDVIHVVGSYEQELLQQMYPTKKIRNIPAYIYEQKPNEQSIYDWSNRKDLLFVGSFRHLPNLDAIVWFAEQVFPSIVEHYPDIIWHIVGANPPAEVQKYQGRNLVLHGFLSDDDLLKMYQSCRMVVVPLRYGAGVKGKILEASYNQVPIVTTPIGAEGIPQEENNMIVCNTAEEFADTVCELYQDEKRLNSMSEGGRRLIEKYYTEENAINILKQDMPELQL